LSIPVVASTIAWIKEKYGAEKLREMSARWGIVPLRELKLLSSEDQTALVNAVATVGPAPNMGDDGDDESYWRRVLEASQIKDVDWDDLRIYWHKRMAGVGAMEFPNLKEEEKFIQNMLHFMRDHGHVDNVGLHRMFYKKSPLGTIGATVNLIKKRYGVEHLLERRATLWSQEDDEKMLKLAEELKLDDGRPDVLGIAKNFPDRPRDSHPTKH
ncbi:hypothetical protein HDU76_004936, partial [Blyttiomyces sp. JEL0837]